MTSPIQLTADWSGVNHHAPQLVRAVVREGVDVRGYFAWSLLDNFEWSEGYRMRFGLVHVDFATQRRTLTSSARWYANLIKAHQAKDST